MTAPSTGCEKSIDAATASSVTERTSSLPPGSGSPVQVPTARRIESGFAMRPTTTSPVGSGTGERSTFAGGGAVAIGFVAGVVGAGGGFPPPHPTATTSRTAEAARILMRERAYRLSIFLRRRNRALTEKLQRGSPEDEPRPAGGGRAPERPSPRPRRCGFREDACHHAPHRT